MSNIATVKDQYITGGVVNEYGFFPNVGGGSESTYWADYFWQDASYAASETVYAALVGGDCLSNSIAGPWQVYLNNTVTDTHWIYKACLSFVPRSAA